MGVAGGGTAHSAKPATAVYSPHKRASWGKAPYRTSQIGVEIADD